MQTFNVRYVNINANFQCQIREYQCKLLMSDTIISMQTFNVRYVNNNANFQCQIR